YWKPEQPPPTTATRKAVGIGLCIFMISFTLELALGVKLSIIPLASAPRVVPRRSTQLLYYSKTSGPPHRSSSGSKHRFSSAFSTSANASHTIRCSHEAPLYAHSRRRHRPGSLDRHQAHPGSLRRRDCVGRNLWTRR